MLLNSKMCESVRKTMRKIKSRKKRTLNRLLNPLALQADDFMVVVVRLMEFLYFPQQQQKTE
jgi:hypothetical protein